jgi:N-ethylmaleimide reductase
MVGSADFSAAEVLLQPFRLSEDLTLANRVLMAPMTRSMADPDLAPTPATAEYYARRAAIGLIVSEGVVIRPDGQGYWRTPGLWTEPQVAAWRNVVSQVHESGGRIFAQLWHVGRVSHPTFLAGTTPLAPSAVALEGRVPRTEGLFYGTPRALDAGEMPDLVDSFARAAERAQRAGFDGVEIHGANGYLIDQFLHHETNRRDDAWGGSPERMARFALTVVDAVAAVVGSGRLGLRLSPGAYTHLEGDPRDALVFRHLLGELEARRLAFIHVGVFDDAQRFAELEGATASEFLRAHYRGTLVGNGGYTPETGAAAIGAGRFDLVAFGRALIANPDLIERLRAGAPLQAYENALLRSLW